MHATIVESAEGFAEQVALVLEVALAQDDRARLAVFEDRDRIGRDLHDLVIQRLFAVGLMLENTSRLAGDGRVADRISTAVDQLDETIKDIRRTIFELANPERAADLRDAIEATITGIMPSLGFRPKVHTCRRRCTAGSPTTSGRTCSRCCARRCPTSAGTRRRAPRP